MISTDENLSSNLLSSDSKIAQPNQTKDDNNNFITPIRSLSPPLTELSMNIMSDRNNMVEVHEVIDNDSNDDDGDDHHEQEEVEFIVDDEQERLRKEEEDSIKLAWELSQQESEEAYNIQMEFLNNNGDDMNDEDRALIQSLINENNIAGNHHAGLTRENNHEGENADNNDDEENNNELTTDESEEVFDYQRLLELGETIGDVKTEQWRAKASSVIDRIPLMTYNQVQSIMIKQRSQQEGGGVKCTTSSNKNMHKNSSFTGSSNNTSKINNPLISNSNSSKSITTIVVDEEFIQHSSPLLKQIKTLETKCSICRDEFVCSDILSILPCQHYFHQMCTNPWLQNHNSCPLCKDTISNSPY